MGSNPIGGLLQCMRALALVGLRMSEAPTGKAGEPGAVFAHCSLPANGARVQARGGQADPQRAPRLLKS